MDEVEVKGLVEDILKKIRKILEETMTYEEVHKVIKASYHQGLDETEKRIKPAVNLVPNDKAIQFLAKYTFDNVKDVNDDIVKRLRKELIAGLMAGESTAQLAERVKESLNVGKVRAAAIARTETHRAYNYGAANAARQSGLTLRKYAYNPDPKTDICKHVANRKPIPLEDKFHYEGQEWDSPPFHVNCRSKLLFEQVDDDK